MQLVRRFLYSLLLACVIGMIQARDDAQPDYRLLSRSLTYQAIVAEWRFLTTS